MVDNFVADLSELAKRIAIEQLKVAFGAGAKLAGTKLSPLPVATPAASPVRAPARSRPRAPVSRARRGQREIEALRSKLLAAISEQPGRRAEDISVALGTKTPEIAQSLRKLVAERVVRTEGARRGTRYYLATPPDAQNGRRPEVLATAEEPAV